MRKVSRPRLRTVSDNYLNIDNYRDRSIECIITSSWEIPKTNYGRIRVSPSPTPANRHCMDSMPGPATKIQTYHVTSFNNSLSRQVDQQNKVFKTVKDFVDEFSEDDSKKRYISKVLVATNGIAAVKCILSMRKLMMQLFKDDHKIKFICLTTEQEIQSKAEYLKMADHIVFSPAGANNNNYANVDEIVEHAVRQGVDAVWAGWGHASENPKLPEELNKRNILFIGPPSNAMFALGDKIASTIIAQTENVPTIEWSGSGLTVPDLEPSTPGVDPQEVCISKDLYAKACVSNWREGLESLREKNIIYPVMIKASEGGGGKGIRRCNNDEEFRINFHRVEAEVPGSPIFLMRCMENARHIEVQLIADQYGNVLPIFTRDCSIQRRCQKIIEEAPANIAPPEVLRQMQQDAVNLAKRVGYVSAGTVEYLYLPENQKYYFLELNPRLQVEHPCTEMVANLNIPAIQLQVAMGLPLHRIVDIRLFFGMDRYGITSLPEDQIKTETNIAVIAARITSEDPAEGFRPASGSVEYLNFQSNQNVWGYFSVSSSGKVHEYADSQFGHLFAKGTTRYEAISAMLCALKELELRATFTSQVNYLVGLLQSPEFEQNRFHTGWLDARIASKVQSVPELPQHVTIAVGATVIGHARISEVFSKFQNAIERGQILPTSDLTETWEVELVHNNVKYSVLVNRYGPINFLVCLNNSKVHTEVRELGNGELLVTYADNSYQCHLDEETERYKLTINRTQTIFEKENDPSRLRSRNAGRLLQYLKKDGEHVAVGDVYAEMESMKMVINLEVKKAGGKLKQIVQPGQALYPGTIIAELENQDDAATVKPTDFKTTFPEWIQSEEQRLNANIRLNTKIENLLNACTHILNGYSVPESMYKAHVKQLVDDLFAVLDDKTLPFALFKVMLHVVETRIRSVDTHNKIKDLIKEETYFQASELTEVMENYLSSLNPSDLGMEKQWFEALLRICEKFENGLEGHKQMVVKEFLETFLNTEKYFQEVTYDQGVSNLKDDVLKNNKEESNKAVRMVYSHTRVHAKNLLLREIVSRLDEPLVVALKPTLQKISNLFNKESEPLALYIRELLNKMHQTSYDQLCSKISRKTSEKSLSELIKVCSEDGGDTILRSFMNGNAENKQLLHEFFFTANRETNIFAIKQYIRQTFYIEENDIDVIPTSTNKATIFKFEIKPFTPLYPNTVQNPTKPERVIYFLSVLNQLDLFRCEEIHRLHKQHAHPHAKNTFLFVAFPKGENGFNTAITLPEAELRKLGLMLKEEITQTLQRSGFQNFGVDLMLSRPAHPPLYTQFDFSAKEKLELYRLPSPTENISVSNSPYLLFKYNEKGIVRLFTRYLLRDVASVVQVEKYSRSNPTDLLKNKLVDVIDGACGELRVSTHSDKTITINDCNHILVCIDYDPSLNTSQWWKASVQAIQQCEPFLIKHRVTEVEIIYKDSKQEKNANGKAWESIKVVYTNETGAISEYAVYQVSEDKLKPLTHVDGPCRNAGESVSAAHHPIPQVQVQKKRFQAHKLGTTYVYDFPVVFGRAILDAWKHYKQSDPNSFNKILDTLPENQLKALANHDYHGFVQAREMLLDDKTEELTLCDDEEILRRRANSAENDRGMIAWKMDLWTPDAPKGRSIVVIANDITYQMGSFSMREHQMYQKASEYSRLHKLPRVYIAANSGARIGFAMDIKKRLNVVWKDQNNPIEVKYLSVDNEGENDPILEQVEHTLVDGNQRIDAVIGKENDIGVENLVGSGLIAGETSAAYKEVPTYCLVTGRAVGIGAYVARLSHRIVQVENSHLILTGAPALNSLLGREIYASNGQLGGIQIMHRNGVSHAVAQNDLEGVNTVLRWISFLPVPTSNEETPKIQPMLKDDAARNVLSATKDGEQDIRSLLDPVNGGGLFDKNSFDEIMSDWAKTIVTGRARIRGLPVGVVAVETRTVKSEIPADPATADSQAKMLEQAGRVWYPDSAYKTAEAINDFNHERIPLIFVANIRGFSGGQKDMFDMVLKFGACIVDALQSYTQPIIVYIPPNGELRGGAWAVLDTQINPTCITMLADPDSRGGVLEPKGIVEIKFRAHDLKALMKKCDPLLSRLEKEVENDKHSADEREQLKREIEKRREFLMPIYRTISEKFADLHDTTGRMLAKGAIHDEVPWTEARDYFYELLQVELAKMRIAREYLLANGKSEPLGIEELSVGYKWVEEHLKEQLVSFVRPVQGKSEGRHRRHEYFSQQIVSYAQCENFKRVLEQIVVRRSSSLLQNKLGLMAENTRQNLISEILTSAGETVRNKVLIEQIAALSVEERKNLLKQFT